jgi:translation initiation factor IF-2
MSFDNILGPATIVYLVSATVAALWWASDLTRRVTTVEASTVTAERIARLETEVRGLAENTRELKVGVQELVRELKHD